MIVSLQLQEKNSVFHLNFRFATKHCKNVIQKLQQKHKRKKNRKQYIYHSIAKANHNRAFIAMSLVHFDHLFKGKSADDIRIEHKEWFLPVQPFASERQWAG